MKRLLQIFIFALAAVSVSAQDVKTGFYRVMNVYSERYAYLCDRKGSIDLTSQNADVGALQLWKNHERTLDNPASVLYLKHIADDRYDIQAQGSGLYEIISHYVAVSKQGNNKYWVYASQNGISKYLSDNRMNNKDEGTPGFYVNGPEEIRQWSVFAINETDNYLGVKPTFSVGGKYYAPYFVSFAFRRVSSGMKVYYISSVDKKNGIAVIKEITSDIIPAKTPVIIECSSSQSSNNKIMPVVNSAATPTDNLLAGVYFCNPDRVSPYVGTPFRVATMRTLGVRADGKIGFISTPDNLTTVELNDEDEECLPANSSYLKVTSGTPAELQMMTQTEYDQYISEHDQVIATSITLDNTAATITLGDSLMLTATVKPNDVTNKKVTWTTSNDNVATVVDGKVKAVGIGEAVITATTTDGTNLSASCTVKVNPVLAASISLDKTTAEIFIGESLQLTATVLPKNTTNAKVVWSSSNTNVAVVENGKVVSLALGETTITVATTDGSNLSATCVVKVKPILVQTLTLSQTNQHVVEGSSFQLTATVLPENATNRTLTWTTSNENVATVVDGEVTAVGVGEAIITVSTNDESHLTANCIVVVEAQVIPAESIALDRDTVTIVLGNSQQLTATVLPENTTNTGVTWASSNTDIVTVVNGMLTAVGVGEAKVIVSTSDGTNLSDTCIVIVEPVYIESIVFAQDTVEVLIEDHVQLNYEILPANATNKNLQWISSDDEVATVSLTGYVHAIAVGETRIIARAVDGSAVTASCIVRVKLEDGIVSLTTTTGNEEYFTLDGRQRAQLQRGINIVRRADGSVRKIVVR